uniref:Phosphoadenosine-phosphosulfate reductase n=1 Tax=Siphoviridae sp. ctzyE57 TaxID=2827982 RepID=A0A8S5SHD7_9CAUD|nr:MAG TPA: phosphoadenosine-phosphosulfate reductase [Siphoviridae sp. ctzyE57]
MSIAEDLQQKIDRAIIRLKNFEPEEGYYLAFSGGKDSQCIYHLAKRGNVKFDAHYSVTSVDPPEVVRFIKRQYPDVIFNYPRDKDGNRVTMWNLIQRNSTPPTRLVRYCCRALKENGGVGRVVVTGVRWAESVRRAANQDLLQIRGKPRSSQKLADAMGLEYQITKFNSIVLNDDNDISRRFVEQCYRTCKVMVNPIIDWTDDDVWTYLNDVEDVRHCELYDRG